jgi:FtsP/CotA-like multicopper oxidase with cupredoxin domain
MTDKFTRRELLQLGLTGSVASVLPALSFADRRSTFVPAAVSGQAIVNPSPTLTPYVDALPIPPRMPAGGTIAMAEAMHSYHRDLPAVPSWGYGGQTHLGPTLEAQSGQTATVTFANNLGSHIFPDCINANTDGVEPTDKTAPRTSVHLHGAPNRPEHDGHPMATFLPGTSRTYEFNNDLSATALFYHDHAMGLTQLNVYAGLSGMYWVRDSWDTGQASNPLGLPSGDYEIPLVFKECLLNSDGQLRAYMSHLFDDDVMLPAFLGDVMLVNGKAWPNLNVDRGLYRFRLLNASTETGYDLYFSNKMDFWVIGSEGGLLDTPVAVTHLPIGAGERYDILVDFSKATSGDQILLLNQAPLPGLALMTGLKKIPNFMQFTVGSSTGFTGAVPATLRGGKNQPAKLPALATADKVRTVTLLQNSAPQFPYVEMSLNNLSFEDPDIEMPVQGTTEEWDIVNTTTIPHTIHLHLVQFRIINRQKMYISRYTRANKKPAAGTRYAPPVDGFTKPFSLDTPGDWESGFKDVVLCPENSVTRILVRFPTAAELGFDPDAVVGTGQDGVPIQGYIWHCHMLDHEDHAMMLRYRVVAPGTPAPAAVPASVRRAYCRTPRT